ncbi:MAG: CoA-binding protein [Candidatus Bathyarchaeia archaeon]
MNSEGLRKILSKYRNVAVVGLSKDPSKDSYRVAKYLKENGFNIIPVNPTADEILGEKSYKSLLDIPEEVQKTLEIVAIFRPSDEVSPIIGQVIQLRKHHGLPHVVWMQLGIVNEKAAEKARKAGLTVIMDKCIMMEHKRFFEKE